MKSKNVEYSQRASGSYRPLPENKPARRTTMTTDHQEVAASWHPTAFMSQQRQALRECRWIKYDATDAGSTIQPHVAAWRDPPRHHLTRTPAVHTAPGESSSLLLLSLLRPPAVYDVTRSPAWWMRVFRAIGVLGV